MAYVTIPPAPKGKPPFPPKGAKPAASKPAPGAKAPAVDLKDSMVRRLQK